MTAGPAQDAAAAAAQAGGESDAAAQATHAENMQATIAGSAVDTSDCARGPESSAVTPWPSE
jgi:hypothetical protein